MNRFVFKNIHYKLKSNLVHDTKNKSFRQEIAHDKGNFIIKIDYKKNNDSFVLYHTEVPVEHRGHDLGSLIAQEVFDDLTKHNIKTILLCPFLIKFHTKYPNKNLNLVNKSPNLDQNQ